MTIGSQIKFSEAVASPAQLAFALSSAFSTLVSSSSATFSTSADTSPSRGSTTGCRQLQFRQSQQIVGARHKVAPSLRTFLSAVPTPTQSAHRLHPANDFFYSLANALAGLIPLRPGRARIQSRHLHTILACHMGRDLSLPTTTHERFLVIPLVRPEGLRVGAFVQLRVLVHLLQRHHGLAFADRIVDREVRAQAVAIFHQHMSAKAQLRFLTLGLAIQHAFGIGAALVRLIRAPLAFELDRRVTGIVILGRANLLLVLAVFAHEALETGPRFNQRAVGGEMLVTGPAGLAGQIVDFGKEQLGDISREHPLVVLGEDAVVEAAFVELAVKKPQPEQNVAELFAEQSLTAHAVEGREHTGFEQLLGRDAGWAKFLVEIVEQRREPLQDSIHMTLDDAQRMIRGHTGVEIDDGQEVRLRLRGSTHAILDIDPFQSFKQTETFSTAC